MNSPSNTRVAVVQIGGRQGYVVPSVLQSAGLLERLFTDIDAGWWPIVLAGRALPARLRPRLLAKLLSRQIPDLPAAKIARFPAFGLAYPFRRKRAVAAGELLAFYRRSDAQFCRAVVRRGLGDATAVYGYNGAALEVFEHARQRGLRTVLEQTLTPVAGEQALLRAEYERWPGWEPAPPREDQWRPSADREAAEWRLADRIVCGSEWVRQGLAASGAADPVCRVVPYAAPDHLYAEAGERRSQGGELRVLFAGNAMLRKGIQYLMEAGRRLAHANVRIRAVGAIGVSDVARPALAEVMELTGPVPRSAMVDHYRWADVFALPTICEGSAVVCYEALAAGLPVVTTPNAGSVVRDGLDGFIVPAGDADALAERLARLAGDRALLGEMSASAAARARDFTWQRYAERLLAVLSEVAT